MHTLKYITKKNISKKNIFFTISISKEDSKKET